MIIGIYRGRGVFFYNREYRITVHNRAEGREVHNTGNK